MSPRFKVRSNDLEYRAMAHATCELVWLKYLQQELHFCEDN